MQRPNHPSRSLSFPAAPNVDYYTAVGSVAAAKERLAEVIHEAEGLGVLVGPAGTGKSLLCCLLAESLKDDFHVVLLADSQLTSGETLLKHILFHLNMPYRDLSEGELRLSLIDQLTQGLRGSSKPALALIIDEAQTLSTRLLEEVRMITNIVRDGQPRVRTILAGGSELEDRLNDPKLESLNQRVAARCYLHPLTMDEMSRYVHEAAMRSGVNPGFLIDDDALRVVYQATGGVPRLVNQLMRQVTAANPAETIRAEHVNQAWQSLQQLPSPLTDSETASLNRHANGALRREADIVEYGSLSAEPAETVSRVDPASVSPCKLAAPDVEQSNESIVPVADADPALAAELDRVTESLHRLAAAMPEHTWRELEDEVVGADAPTEPEAAEVAESSDADVANLQFDCHAEVDLPANFCDAFGSQDLRLEWDTELPESAQFEETASFESFDVQQQEEDVLPPGSGDGAVSPADSEREIVPLNISQEPVLPREELFGADFDEEEPITTERNYGTAFGPSLIDPSLSTDPESPNDTEIEDNVHGQILGMMDATADVPVTLDFRPQSDSSSGINMHDDIQLSDDSDLLVIEESVEIEPVRIQPPMFDDDASDSSDYQALLNRMRQG